MLVKQLYHKTNSKSKEALWFCFGEIIFENLQKNIGNKKSICLKCGKRFEKEYPNQEYCEQCGHEYEKTGKKIVVCIDCGKEFVQKSKANKSIRCSECYKLWRRIKKTETMRKLRE